jgi:hypothetical protein
MFLLVYGIMTSRYLKIKYKKPTIISGTGAAIWSKTNFELTDHHHPHSSNIYNINTELGRKILLLK